jgi:hypothetical protein
MKKSILILTSLLFVNFFSHAQTDNSVNVIAFGDGKTKDEATNTALRHCIEKTFGVFVTTNTQVVNDELIKDDIATIASGNIVSYEVISELQKGDLFSVTVSATVSPDNIVKTYKSKGYSFEINGNVYAQNIQKEKFYKQQEPIIVKEFLSRYINYPLFDTFEIKIGEPFHCNGTVGRLHNSKNCLYSSGAKTHFDRFYPVNPLKYKYLRADNQSLIKPNVNSSPWNSGNILSKDNLTEHYIIPVDFYPHFNEINSGILSDIISKFLENISIKEKDYDSKYGSSFLGYFAFLDVKINKKGKIRQSITTLKSFSFRNSNTLYAIADFAEKIDFKSTPNSLEIKNNNFELTSAWYAQEFQNKSHPINKSDLSISLGNKNLLLNFSNGIMSRNSIWNDSYQYRPCLLFVNITESELSKLKTLEFFWK